MLVYFSPSAIEKKPFEKGSFLKLLFQNFSGSGFTNLINVTYQQLTQPETEVFWKV